MNTVHQGDCLELMLEMPDGSIDMVLADPPYGTTACKWDSIIPLEPMWKQLKRVTKQNAAIVMTASQPFTTKLISSNMEWFKYCWVWDKGQGTGFLNSEKQPLRQAEDILIFYDNQPTYNPQMRSGFKPYRCYQGMNKIENYGKQTGALTISTGERFPVNIIKITRDNSQLHPTQKPVALMAYLIKTYTNEGDTVLDFCCGSGTTGVACKRWNRNFILMEREPEYCDIARKRLAAEDNLFTEGES